MSQVTAAMVKELRDATSAAMMDCKKALAETNGNMEEAKEYLRIKGQATADKKSSRETKEGAVAAAVSASRAAVVKIACETDFVAINDAFQGFVQDLAEQALETGVEGFEEKTSKKGKIKDQLIATIAKMGENMTFVEGAAWDVAANAAVGAYVHGKGKIGVITEVQAGKAVAAEALTALAKDISMHIAANQVAAVSEADLDPAVLEKEKAILIEQAKESGKPMNIIEKMVEGRMTKFKREICLLEQPFVKNSEQTIAALLKEQGKALGADLKVTRFYKSSF